MDLMKVCRTCMARERTLRPPEDYAFFIKLLPQSVMCTPLPIHICWECSAKFSTILKFIQKAKLSAENLQRLWNDNQKDKKISLDDLPFNGYSRLTSTINDSYLNFTHSPLIEIVIDCVKQENESQFIKEETSDIEDDIPLIGYRKVEEADTQNLDIETNEDASELTLEFGSRENSILSPTSLSETEKYRISMMTQKEFDEFRKIEEQRIASHLHKCVSCLVSFEFSDQLVKHCVSSHHPSIGTHKCNICQCRFTTDNNLKRHIDKHYERHECLNCEFRTIDKKDIERHIETHRQANHVCKLCKERFETLADLKDHIKNDHEWRCKLCTKIFGLRGELWRHNRQEHSKYPIACPHCGKLYNKKQSLEVHLQMHEDASSIFYCAECDMHFKTNLSLKTHLTTASKHVTEEKLKYVCDICGKKFLTRLRLECHINALHLDLKKYSCSKCDKSYANKQSLGSHMKYKHRKDDLPRDKICEICAKAFYNNVLLRNHMRVHTGERPFMCKLCPSTFSHKPALYTHNRLVHLKVKQTKKQLLAAKLLMEEKKT